MLIRKKLPLVFIILTTLSLFIMGSFFYAYISNILIENNKNKINQLVDMESTSLETYFDTRRLEVDYLSNDALVISTINEYLSDPRYEDLSFTPLYTPLNTYFEQLKDSREDLRDVFVLAPSGRIIASSQPKSYWLDLSDRQYFIDAMKGITTISNLLVDRVDNQSVLFVSAPIHSNDKNHIIGVMANIIDTSKASKSLNALVTASTGNAYLIDQTGMIIFHTNEALIGTRHINSEIDEFFKVSNLSIPNNAQFDIGGLNHYVAYQAIQNTPWILVIDQNMDILMHSTRKAFTVMLFITLSVLFISTVISILFARTLTIPITELSRVMHLTTQGDLSVRSQYLSNNELGMLSMNLNYMLDELTGAYEEVESKNEVLMIAKEELRHNYDELSQNQSKLQTLQEKYASALNASRDVVWEWTLKDNHFFASELWYEITGLTTYNPNITHMAFEELIQEEEQHSIMEIFIEHWKTHSPLLTFSFSYLCPEHKTHYFLIRANTQWDSSGEPIKTSGIMVDITQERETNNKIHDLAFNSQITALPNRHAYMMKLKKLIESENSAPLNLTVFQMDIDNFMRVNDALGHSIGNELLRALAERLKSACHKNMCVFHLSADEFAFILAHVSTETEITEIIDDIYHLINEPFVINNRSIYISMSTGISVYPNDGDSVEKLIQNADTAMFTAKQTGKSNYVFYTNLLSESVQTKLYMEEILRRAVKDHLLSMHYQPQYNVSNQKIDSFEALMRLTLEDHTSISPSNFIPVAEENGFIIELGEWALRTVCKTIKAFIDLGYNFEHISVNVSSIQLQHPNFVSLISEITSFYEIEPHYLELEITESVLLNVSNEQENKLSMLSNMGYKIALDDFGTGYSSFSYLRTMPLSTLKIDKTFIDDLKDSKKDQELVRQMIELSHELGIKVIAEGVETHEQYVILKSLDCDYIQGYYFSKPITLEKVRALLAQ